MPRPRTPRRRAPRRACEQVEDTRQVLRVEAHAIVDDREQDDVLLRIGDQLDPPRLWGVLRRVAQQVHQDLDEPQRIHEQLHVLDRQSNLQDVARSVDVRACGFDSALHDLADPNLGPLQLDPPVHDRGDVAELFDEVREVLHLAPHHSARFLEFGRVVRCDLQDGERAAQWREWIAQLVREHREELILAAVTLAQFAHERLELQQRHGDARVRQARLGSVGSAARVAAHRELPRGRGVGRWLWSASRREWRCGKRNTAWARGHSAQSPRLLGITGGEARRAPELPSGGAPVSG
jgi:hypothetical protein